MPQKNCWWVLYWIAEKFEIFLRGPQSLFLIREIKGGNGTARHLLGKLGAPTTISPHGGGLQKSHTKTGQNCTPLAAWGQFQYMKNTLLNPQGSVTYSTAKMILAWKISKAGIAYHPP